MDIDPTSTPQAWMVAQHPPLKRGPRPNIHPSSPSSVDVAPTSTPQSEHPPLKRGCWPTNPLGRGCWPNIHPSILDGGPTSVDVGPTSTPQAWMLARHPPLKRGCWPSIHPSSCWPNIHPSSTTQAWILTRHPWMLAQHAWLLPLDIGNIHPSVCEHAIPLLTVRGLRWFWVWGFGLYRVFRVFQGLSELLLCRALRIGSLASEVQPPSAPISVLPPSTLNATPAPASTASSVKSQPQPAYTVSTSLISGQGSSLQCPPQPQPQQASPASPITVLPPPTATASSVTCQPQPADTVSTSLTPGQGSSLQCSPQPQPQLQPASPPSPASMIYAVFVWVGHLTPSTPSIDSASRQEEKMLLRTAFSARATKGIKVVRMLG